MEPREEKTGTPSPSSLPGRLMVVLALIACLSCVTRHKVVKTSTLEFLYPAGSEEIASSDVTLELPVRVGLAFAPAGALRAAHPITESSRQAILERIAEAFRAREFIGSIEVIPSTYLEPEGGFQNLDRLRSAFGVDLMALLSYEQVQFTASTGRSIAYWTVVGAYMVNGEKNETSTVLEAVIYDIRSRSLLFRAPGNSQSEQRFRPIAEGKELRDAAQEGFDVAAEDLIANLRTALDEFEEQAQSGTVRGIGTPAIRVTQAGQAPGSTGGSGAVAWGIGEMALLLGLGGLGVTSWLTGRARRPG